MTNDVPTRRYAKGDARRREILSAALRVISERGYRNSSLQEIADAVGLTKAGVLHYFDSREDLLAEVLRERDEADDAALGGASDDIIGLLSRTVRHNQTVPGLVELYSRLVVETESAEHPGHEYIGERYKGLESAIGDAVRARQAAGTMRADIDPALMALVITAISDGLQLQWMHDRGIDMAGAFDAAIALLDGPTARS